MNKFHIRRSNMLRALALPDRIPVGLTGEWSDVRVVTGWWDSVKQGPIPDGVVGDVVCLPAVRLMASGVANRVQVLCPACKKRWVRFACLQQHIGTKSCCGS